MLIKKKTFLLYTAYANRWIGALSWYFKTIRLHLISLFYSSVVGLTWCSEEFSFLS